MSKAQIVSEVFTYLLALGIMAAILIYGYNAISDFRERSNQVSLVRLQTDLTSSIEALTADFGTVKKKVILLGESASICFVENYATPNIDPLQGINPIISNSVNDRTGKNIFILKDTVESSFSTSKISVEPDVLCMKAINSEVVLRLEGLGDHVSVSPWQQS